MWTKFEFDCVFVETDKALASVVIVKVLRVESFQFFGEDNSPEALSIILLVTSDITEEVSDKAVISGDADSNVVCPVGKMASSVEILPGNFQ